MSNTQNDIKAAARQIGEKIHADDVTKITYAALSAAKLEINENLRFKERVEEFYQFLNKEKAARAARPAGAVKTEEFIPIKFMDAAEINPAKTADPFIMYEGYGREQYSRMLERYTKSQLRDAVEIIEARRAMSLSNKKSASARQLISFILQHADSTARAQPSTLDQEFAAMVAAEEARVGHSITVLHRPMSDAEKRKRLAAYNREQSMSQPEKQKRIDNYQRVILPQPEKQIDIRDINPYDVPDVKLLADAYGAKLAEVLETFTVPVLQKIAAKSPKIPVNIQKSRKKSELIAALLASLQ